MRRPHFCCDKDHYDEQCCSAQSTGSIARLRRFLGILSRRAPPTPVATPASREPCQSPCIKPCNVLPPAAAFPNLLSDIRGEAENSLGRPLEEVMVGQGQEDAPHGGVPAFIHAVCCHMLTHEVDYETLIADDWCAEEIRSALLDAAEERRGSRGIALSAEESCSQATLSAGLLRLFLQELPHPLIPREVASTLSAICKEIVEVGPNGEEILAVRRMMATRIRRLLFGRLPGHNLRLLQYLSAFFHQLRTANHNTCPVSMSDLSRVLGRVLARSSSEGLPVTDGHRIAQVLLSNYVAIFTDSITPEDPEYNSDVSSSYGSSHGENADTDLFTADEDDDEQTLGIEEDEDDSTTTTTDTDELRSPLKVPLHSSPSGGRPPSPCRSRSTAEIQDVDSFRHTKIAPFGKEYLPSITDLLKCPDESWRDEGIRSYSQDKESWIQSCESSCLSDGEEFDSDGDRDADGSDTEGIFGTGTQQCPHEERRSSERSFPRSHKAPSGSRRPKRRTRRKPEKDAPIRIQPSEEEERDQPISCFTSLLSRQEEPETFDPYPPDDDSSQPFRDLLAFNEPVTSDRASWGLKMDMSHSDKWHRTARHYSSRYETEKNPQGNWFKERDNAGGPPRTSKAFSTPNGSTADYHRPAGQAAVKLLTRNMSSIKKKIKKFEEEFENAFGYRPSHSEKMKHKDIKKYMSELNKARKDLKKMKDDVAGMLTVPNVFPMTLFRCQETTDPKVLEEEHSPPGTVNTLREVEERLREKRKNANRPVDLNSMTADQIQDEKTALQRALLYYESLHGRPSTKEDRDLARPLYDRYRQIKRSIIRSSSRTKENLELAPILEHVVMDFTLASPQHRGSLQDEVDPEIQEEIQYAVILNPDPLPEVIPGGSDLSTSDPKSDDEDSPRSDINLGDLHALPSHELKERKKEAKDDKKRLRRSLRDYEEKFERETGRKVQKEDRGPMEDTYMDYKHAKAKLRLLEALLSKLDHTSLKV